MKKIEVCLLPELINNYDISNAVVVIIDVLRASSCIVAGFGCKVDHFIPLINESGAFTYREQGYLLAGERGGVKIQGFDLGNSPFDYMDNNIEGKKIVITTTNGTRAIDSSSNASEQIIGSFLNFSVVVDYLKSTDKNVVLLPSGWNSDFSMEDTLLAGAILEKFPDNPFDTDATIAALSLYRTAKNDLPGFVKNASHVKRLLNLGFSRDIDFCFQFDQFPVLPEIENKKIISR